MEFTGKEEGKAQATRPSSVYPVRALDTRMVQVRLMWAFAIWTDVSPSRSLRSMAVRQFQCCNAAAAVEQNIVCRLRLVKKPCGTAGRQCVALDMICHIFAVVTQNFNTLTPSLKLIASTSIVSLPGRPRPCARSGGPCRRAVFAKRKGQDGSKNLVAN